MRVQSSGGKVCGLVFSSSKDPLQIRFRPAFCLCSKSILSASMRFTALEQV